MLKIEWVLFNPKYFISVHKVRYCKPINQVEPKNLRFLLLLTVLGKFYKENTNECLYISYAYAL